MAGDFSSLGLLMPLLSAGGLDDCHLLRDVTGCDDKVDSALLLMSRSPDCFSRHVLLEKADK